MATSLPANLRPFVTSVHKPEEHMGKCGVDDSQGDFLCSRVPLLDYINEKPLNNLQRATRAPEQACTFDEGEPGQKDAGGLEDE